MCPWVNGARLSDKGRSRFLEILSTPEHDPSQMAVQRHQIRETTQSQAGGGAHHRPDDFQFLGKVNFGKFGHRLSSLCIIYSWLSHVPTIKVEMFVHVVSLADTPGDTRIVQDDLW